MSDTAAWSPVAGPPGLAAEGTRGPTGERAFSAVWPREGARGCCGCATVARGRLSHAPTTTDLVAAFGAADPCRIKCGACVASIVDGRNDDATGNGRPGNCVWAKKRPIVQSR